MGFYLVWANSFQKRIIQKEPRRCLIMIAAMMVFGMPSVCFDNSILLPTWGVLKALKTDITYYVKVFQSYGSVFVEMSDSL